MTPYGHRLLADRKAMQDAAPGMDSNDWTRALEKAGYRVLHAV
jgi:hypothetical protein